ncbi:MAG: hypothetical protein COU08_04405 [Candidatus Harrisonbacteria bacterium CG10_big_fil_rev_8_21_14_0_10_42_17]|uniref:DUF2231 domain-containing protein n=1 Tax=Candidatus Harrisonbacteria bacterium CG10_big_fil_rev_8_21_14_0_10_42_17 TaxID=1974584 RepID=A0A2M6WH00_9BACT|nr:MAG: hypothetical protein COU08_04405 [Candidatus Harrisonbacteria bacterium CG10_big_fil_rev_8_21_14_0_10_42_17]
MNIHPAIVHFPIAFLMIYAVLEIVPFSRFLSRVPWHVIKLFLLYTGTISLFPAIVAGFIAASSYGETPAVNAHKQVALITSFIFVIIAAFTFFSKVDNGQKRVIVKTLAVLGFLGMLFTGALGANLVYGSDGDFMVSFVVKLFGLQ